MGAYTRSNKRWLRNPNQDMSKIKGMRLLGIDYGETHIGFAFKPEDSKLAVPHQIFDRKPGDREALIDEAKDIVDELEVEMVIVGLPLTLQGKPDKMCDRVALFIHDLRKNISVRVDQEDERMTTRMAGKHAHDLSAAIILQTYIDTN